MPLLAALIAIAGLALLSAGLLRTATPQGQDEAGEAQELDTFRAKLDDSFGTRVLGAGGGVAESVIRRLTPSTWHANLLVKIRLAGLETTLAPGIVYTGKAIGLVAGAALFGGAGAAASVPRGLEAFLVVFGLVAGFMAPDIVLGQRADQRQNALRRTLPEALDLMAITVQAGVGLEQAVAVVTERLKGPLGEEFNRFLNEVQLGFSRREALQNLRERNDCPELSTFILSMLQADALGIAVGEVLKTQATEIRAKRRQRARERAAKAPVRLLFPLIFGILPALFVVILGPAGLTISKAFRF
ncbi:MAG: type secretion system family protein [Frankiales bacterium]|nr:type secretion system family protein [Frankiales bacterium]